MAKSPDSNSFNSSEESVMYDSIEGLLSVGEPMSPLSDISALFQPDSSALQVFEQPVPEEPDPARRLYQAGLLHHFKNDEFKALEALENAYGLFLSAGDYLGSIECLIELAWIKYNQEGEECLAKATRLFSEATKMIHVHMHQPGINETRGKLLHYQGLVEYREKNFGEAVKHMMYAKTFCRADGLEAARILDSLAVHYEHTNDYYRAIQCLGNALSIKQQLNCTYELAVTYQIMGRIHILREEYPKAEECLTSALNITRAVGDVYRSARIKNDLIRLSIYQNDLAQAQALIQQVETECQSRDMRVLYGQSQFYKAYIYYGQLDYASAKSLLEHEILPVFKRGNYRKGFAMASRLLACIYYRDNQGMQAIEAMSEVIAIFKEEGEIAELAKTYYELGKIYISLNEPKLALASMLEALRISEANGLSFIISHIEDEIFRLNEEKWQEIVQKRANHDRVFDKEVNLLEALASLEGEEKEVQPESGTPNKRLVSLLRVGQAMAGERELDKLLPLIKIETEQALEADRCTVFIYDREHNELWSKVASGFETSEEIRFPAHLGLAGYVVKTGEVLNIKNAYEDPRFNKEIDKKTGYVTHNILCMPMRNRKLEIIGVFQVLNKRGSHFDKVDEDLLTAISTNAGVAIENATLAKEMKISFDSFVKTLSSTIDARDPITAGHSERVAEYSVLLGEEMEMQEADLEALKYASLLHDIGKIGIQEDILKKDGRLTEKEYRHIQKHVYYTHEILKNVHFERHLQLVPEIAASHHEKMDGTGYHRGLSGTDILLSGRILAISDVFDAITSRRHYRNRMAFDKVLTIMKRDAGAHFDPDCVEAFFNIPLYQLSQVLLMDRGDASPTEGQSILAQLDKHVTIGEYFKYQRNEQMTKGQADVHRVFTSLYHYTGLMKTD